MLSRKCINACVDITNACLAIILLIRAYDNGYFADLCFFNLRPFAGVSSLNVVLILLSLSWYVQFAIHLGSRTAHTHTVPRN